MLTKLYEIYKVLPPEYQTRLKHELDVIQNNSKGDFLPYFMTLSDICDFCENNNIPIGPGRGSAAASLVSYLLGITSLDPIRYNLPFSRFLSKERLEKSVPDIDLDFPKIQRQLVTDYIFKKYGERAAFVSAIAFQKLKNSLQDSFRINVVQPSQFEIKQFAKTNTARAATLESELKRKTQYFDSMRKNLGFAPIGRDDNEWLDGFENDGAREPGLLETNSFFAKFVQEYPKVYETARELLGIPRQMSTHAAGVVIANINLHEFVPVMKVDGRNVIAYDKKIIAKLGLVKQDLLGLVTLSFINDTLELIGDKNLVKQKWDLPDDAEVYKEFIDGKCRTLFQWDTSSGSAFAKKLKPTCKSDIFDGVAINRPGATNAMIKFEDGTEKSAAETYLLRKDGKLPVTYLHKDLEPILGDTQALWVYQESVMKSIQDLLGFSEAESDQIRAAISDKNIKGFDAIKERLPKLKERGWTDSQVSEFFEQLSAFSGFAFNKAHSASYGLISYTTAYLKNKFPLEWWASVLTGTEPNEIIEKMWPEISHLIDLPDVNTSSDRFVIKNKRLVPPLKLINNVGPKAIQDISSKSPFASLQDFADRIDSRVTNKRCVINLIKAGAMDSQFSANTAQKDKIKLYLETRKESAKKIAESYKEFEDLNAVQEYIDAKKAFPVKIASLSDAVAACRDVKLPLVNISHTICGQEMTLPSMRGAEPLVNGALLSQISSSISRHNEKSIDVCSFGYVLKVRQFSYFSKKLNVEKSAVELVLDFDNFIVSTVVWPRSADYAPAIASHIKEENAYLFKIRINKDENWRYGISGLEQIL